MDQDLWVRVGRVLHPALDLTGRERSEFIEEACGQDLELKREVEELIAEHEKHAGFLDRPLVDLARTRESTDRGADDRYIDEYRLVRRLGRGGMGEVYLAVREGDDFRQTVAIKIIRRGMDTEEVLERFKLERRIVASLDHANIAGLLDGGATEDGRPYFVMEYVDGTPIDEYCDGARLGVDARLLLFGTICDAVQHAHQNLIVHRDLKPGNILVTADGVPKLLDFGIGKLLATEGSGRAGLTGTDVRVLTPEYASPEQIRAEQITTASDVFSLGIVLYELLTGRHPFGGRPESLAELERAITEEEPPVPSRVPRRRALAGDLDNIVLKALRKEPSRRYVSAAALGEDLERYRAGLPVRARPDSARYRASKFVRRHAGAVGAAALVLLLLAGSTVLTQVQNRRIRAESERVTRERDKAQEVESFLLEMFGAVGPEGREGDAVSARTLLDLQAQTIEQQYADDSRLQAEMEHVVADGYQRLGLFEAAETHARRGLQVLDGLGDAGADAARTRSLLGWILHERGELEAAETELRAAVTVLREAGAPETAALSRALNDLGAVRSSQEDLEEAETLQREALALRIEAFGEEHRAVGITASNLSVTLYQQGDYAGAIDLARQARRALEAALGPDHQRVAIVRSNIAALSGVIGDWAAAEAEYRVLLGRAETVFGPSTDQVAAAALQLSNALIRQGDAAGLAEAEDLITRALGIREAKLGPAHQDVAKALDQLALVQRRRARFAESAATRERALEIYRDRLGDAHTTVGLNLRELGNTYWDMGDTVRARRLQAAALTNFETALGPRHPQVAAQQALMGRNLVVSGRPEEGLPVLEAAHELAAEVLPAGHRLITDTRIALAEAYVVLGSFATADSLIALVEENVSTLDEALRDRTAVVREAITANDGGSPR